MHAVNIGRKLLTRLYKIQFWPNPDFNLCCAVFYKKSLFASRRLWASFPSFVPWVQDLDEKALFGAKAEGLCRKMHFDMLHVVVGDFVASLVTYLTHFMICLAAIVVQVVAPFVGNLGFK